MYLTNDLIISQKTETVKKRGRPPKNISSKTDEPKPNFNKTLNNPSTSFIQQALTGNKVYSLISNNSEIKNSSMMTQNIIIHLKISKEMVEKIEYQLNL
jgi:hypothetical protein